jgi:hypothetical protein
MKQSKSHAPVCSVQLQAHRQIAGRPLSDGRLDLEQVQVLCDSAMCPSSEANESRRDSADGEERQDGEDRTERAGEEELELPKCDVKARKAG